jgi:hypothetical protein
LCNAWRTQELLEYTEGLAAKLRDRYMGVVEKRVENRKVAEAINEEW